MNNDYSILAEHAGAFYSVIIVTLAFLTFHFVTTLPYFQTYIGKRYGKKQAKVYSVVVQRLAGLLLYGIVPVFLSLLIIKRPLYQYGLNYSNIATSLIWAAILVPIIIIINIINAKKPDNLNLYPQIRRKKWTSSLLVLSALSWVAYLVAYEFAFRGFLLFSLNYTLGPPLAIAISTSVYALVHVPKGWKEALGAIPLGIVLSVITLETGSIVVALLVHIVMALSNEWLSIQAHPKMKFVSKR